METSNINSILLKDIGTFSGDYQFNSILKKCNVTTLGQLFNDEIIETVMEKCSRNTRIQLRGYIAALKFHYLKTPIINGDLLEERTKKSTFYQNEPKEGNRFLVNFNLLGFNNRQRNEIYYAERELNDKLLGMNLIDFFKKIVERRIGHENTRKLIQIYIDFYERNNELSNAKTSESDTIVFLKEQLTKLIITRDTLDKQILDLKEKIGSLSNEQSIGGYLK